jgi:ribose 5-phosphate isomerase
VSYTYYLFYRPGNSSPEQLNNLPQTAMGLGGGTTCSKEHRDLVRRITEQKDNLVSFSFGSTDLIREHGAG